MNVHPVLLEISKDLIKNPNKHEAHKKITPLIQNLCNDMNFIREALKIYLSNPKSLEDIRNNTITLLSSGDLIFAINIFCPLRDGAKNIISDNIHHHGWRLLSTGIISGDGYDTINFVKNTHMARDNNEVKLKIKLKLFFMKTPIIKIEKIDKVKKISGSKIFKLFIILFYSTILNSNFIIVN